jgi:hypothetical protein
VRPLSPVKGGLGASLHSADIRQVAIFLGVVGTVADHKDVADREADEIDRDLDLPPLRLVEQRTNPEIADPALAQLGDGTGDRPAGIDDVVDEQYRPPGKIGLDIAEKLHRTAALFGKTIAGEPDEFDLGAGARPVQCAGEVGDKHRRTLGMPTMTKSAGIVRAISAASISTRVAISAALNRTRISFIRPPSMSAALTPGGARPETEVASRSVPG